MITIGHWRVQVVPSVYVFYILDCTYWTALVSSQTQLQTDLNTLESTVNGTDVS